MQRQRKRLPAPGLAVFLALAAVLPCGGQGGIGPAVTVFIEDPEVEFPLSQFGTVLEHGQPLHGVLLEGTGEMTVSYVPDPDGDFWTLGQDSFTVRIDEAEGPRIERVSLVADSRTELRILSDFEDPATPGDEYDPGDQLEVSAAGAIVELGGVLVDLEPYAGADAHLTIPIAPAGATHGEDRGGCAEYLGSGTASGAGGTSLPPGTGLPAECVIHGDCTVGVFQVYDSLDQEVAFEIQMSLAPEGTAVRLRGFERLAPTMPREERATAWFPITAEPRSFRLDWWLAGSGLGGGVLRVDGRFAGELRNLANSQVAGPVYRIGAFGATASLDIAYKMDHLGRYGGQTRPEVTVHAVSEFEQDFSPWEARTGAGDVRRTATAAMVGFAGTEVEFGTLGGWGAFLLDESLPSPDSLAVRFAFSADDLNLGKNEFMLLMAAYDGIASAAKSKFKMSFSEWNDGVVLKARVRNDADVWSDVYSGGLGAGRHVVEGHWRESSAPGVDNGCFRFWLEGDLRGEACGLDVDETTLRSIRLGAMNLQDETWGKLYLDSVEIVWHQVVE